eukprot:177497-Chlamydomonas_euryale.AAC.1
MHVAVDLLRRASAGARLWAADMDVEEAVHMVAQSAEEPALRDPVPAVGTATLGALREWCVRAAALCRGCRRRRRRRGHG